MKKTPQNPPPEVPPQKAVPAPNGDAQNPNDPAYEKNRPFAAGNPDGKGKVK
jgi:hypothetical protein